MQVLDSLVDGPLELADRREADELIGMIVRYLRTGEEPEPRTDAQRMAIAMVRPVLEKSRARAAAGSRGGSAAPRDGAGADGGRAARDRASAVHDRSQASKAASKRASKRQSKKGSKRGSDIYSSSSSLQEDPRDGLQPVRGFQVEGEPGGFSPPSLDEVRAYWEANALRGDPEAFFATYDSQGWVKGNGLPVHSWMSLALKWSREQVGRDAERPPGEMPRPMPRASNAVDSDEDIARDLEAFRRKWGDAPC